MLFCREKREEKPKLSQSDVGYFLILRMIVESLRHRCFSVVRVWERRTAVGQALPVKKSVQWSVAKRGHPTGPYRGLTMSAAGKEEPTGETATKLVNVIIKGKVQGVYYRNWTVEAALQLGVDGWVRNMKDGSVEAVFSGKATAVDALIEKCHGGPSAARVSGVEVSPWKGDVSQGFERKPTIW